MIPRKQKIDTSYRPNLRGVEEFSIDSLFLVVYILKGLCAPFYKFRWELAFSMTVRLHFSLVFAIF